MIYDLVTFGGILFWIIAGVFTLVIAGQINSDKVGSAFLTLVIALVVIIGFTSVPLLSTIRENPIYIAYFFGAYFGGATIWSFIKWRMFFLPKMFDRYNALRSDWLAEKGLKEFPADPTVRSQFNEVYEVKRLNIGVNRMVRNNKGRITTWMVFWPFSLIETFFGDFLTRVFATIYKMVSGSFQRMSDRMASQYSELN